MRRSYLKLTEALTAMKRMGEIMHQHGDPIMMPVEAKLIFVALGNTAHQSDHGLTVLDQLKAKHIGLINCIQEATVLNEANN
jgi:hypothetical protein